MRGLVVALLGIVLGFAGHQVKAAAFTDTYVVAGDIAGAEPGIQGIFGLPISIGYSISYPTLPVINDPINGPFTTYWVGVFVGSALGGFSTGECISNFSAPGPGGICDFYTHMPLLAAVTPENPNILIQAGGDFTSISFFLDPFCGNGDCSGIKIFDANEIAASVPEPSTWAMLLIGFAGIGFASHRRSRRVNFIYHRPAK